MLKIPDSMDEIVYFTSRTIGKGHAKAWAKRQNCTKCHGALMGKPKDSKGKIKTRAKEYTCPKCNYTVEKEEYESSLSAEIIYTCPSCGKSGEATAPFKRKKINGVETLRIQCGFCKANIDITKKMAEGKEKGK